MAYRGQDLDLRVAQVFEGHRAADRDQYGSGALGAQYPNGGDAGTFHVEDGVLACFNHAFDIASAHRAPEVRIAHLLLATTRISETVAALQARAVHVPGLMRDTAAIVASQFPINPSNGQATPKSSRELEDVLRHAASLSDRTQMPITADQLIDVLFEMKTEVAGIELLDRNAGHGATKGRSDVRDTPRERIRLPAGTAHYATRPAGRTTISNTATDSIQNSRLDALEQMVRALVTDLANERQTFSEVLSDIQREEPQYVPPATQYVEYETYPEPPPPPPRVHVASPQAAPPPSAPIVDGDLSDRIDGMMREMSRLNSRLGSIETEITRVTSAASAGDVNLIPLVERLESLEAVIRDVQKDRGQDVSEVADRISDLETLISDRGGNIDVDLKPVTDRLDVIEEAVMSVDTGDSAVLSQEIKVVAERVAAQALMQTKTAERLEGIGADVTAQRTDLAGSITNLQSMLTAEINGDRSDTSEFVHEIGQVHEALMKLNSNQHTLAASIETWRETGARDLSLMSSRMETVMVEASRPTQMLETMSANMEGMYRATVERYHRRNRLWYWLFGTDDWVTASWPSTTARIDADRRGFKV